MYVSSTLSSHHIRLMSSYTIVDMEIMSIDSWSLSTHLWSEIPKSDISSSWFFIFIDYSGDCAEIVFQIPPVFDTSWLLSCAKCMSPCGPPSWNRVSCLRPTLQPLSPSNSSLNEPSLPGHTLVATPAVLVWTTKHHIPFKVTDGAWIDASRPMLLLLLSQGVLIVCAALSCRHYQPRLPRANATCHAGASPLICVCCSSSILLALLAYTQ